MRPGPASRFAFKAKAGPTADPKARLKTRSVSRLVLVATLASQALVFAAAAAPAGAAPVVALPAAATGTITEFRPTGISQTATSDPLGITTGPDGNLWFTEYNANKVAKVTTSGTFTEYTLVAASSQPRGITVGSDGNLWVAEQSNNKIAKVTTGGTITEYAGLNAGSQPYGLTAGPDGLVAAQRQGCHELLRLLARQVVERVDGRALAFELGEVAVVGPHDPRRALTQGLGQVLLPRVDRDGHVRVR